MHPGTCLAQEARLPGIEKGVGRCRKPDSHEGSSGGADPGTDGNTGERKECSFSNELWCSGAGSDRAALGLSGTPEGPHPKGEMLHESAQFWSKARGH